MSLRGLYIPLRRLISADWISIRYTTKLELLLNFCWWCLLLLEQVQPRCVHSSLIQLSRTSPSLHLVPQPLMSIVFGSLTNTFVKSAKIWTLSPTTRRIRQKLTNPPLLSDTARYQTRESWFTLVSPFSSAPSLTCTDGCTLAK